MTETIEAGGLFGDWQTYSRSSHYTMLTNTHLLFPPKYKAPPLALFAHRSITAAAQEHTDDR